MGITPTASTASGLKQIHVYQKEMSSTKIVTGIPKASASVKSPTQMSTTSSVTDPKKALSADPPKIYFSPVPPPSSLTVTSKSSANPAPKPPTHLLLQILRLLPIPSYLHITIIRKLFLLNDGRDKLLKVVQYAAKALIHLNLITHINTFSKSRSFTLHPLLQIPAKGKAPVVERSEKLVSHLSMARKIIRLAHFLEPVESLKAFISDKQYKDFTAKSFTTKVLALGALVSATTGIVNDLSDDAICLSKMGVLAPSWSKSCGPLSDRLWFLSIIIDMHEIAQDIVVLRAKAEKLRKEGKMAEVQKVDEKLGLQRMGMVKLGADFVFCAYDVFGLGDKGWGEGWQVYSGLVAAVLGTAKLWIKNSK